MAWISKKELKEKLTKLEEKVSELDPEKVSQRLLAAIEELNEFKAQTRKDWEVTNDQLVMLTTKVKKFIFITREVTKGVVQDINNKLREAFGEDFFEEKPEEPTKPDETAVEVESDLLDETVVGVESEQQEVAEGD